MAKKSVGGGPFKDGQTRRERLSSIVSGDTRDRNKAGPSLVRMTSAALSPRLGMPVGGLMSRPPKDQSRVFSERTLGGLKQRAAAAAEPKGYVMGQNLTAPKPKAKPSSVVRTTTDMKTTPAKAQAARPSFKGNWVGAAPTAMQARGGARIDRGGGLFGKMGGGSKASSSKASSSKASGGRSTSVGGRGIGGKK